MPLLLHVLLLWLTNPLLLKLPLPVCLLVMQLQLLLRLRLLLRGCSILMNVSQLLHLYIL